MLDRPELGGGRQQGGGQEVALLIALPALLLVVIPVTGRIYASDLLALAVFPLVAFVTHWRTVPALRYVLIAGAAWQVGQILSDLANHSSITDTALGNARIFTFLVYLVLLAQLLTSERRIKLFVVASATSGALAVLLSPTRFSEGEPWKFGFGGPASLVAVLAASALYKRGQRLSASLLLGGLALVHFTLNFRSQALVIAGVVTALICAVGAHTGSRKEATRRALAFVVVFCVCALAGTTLYDRAASSGALGARTQAKYRFEAALSDNALLSGRVEIRASSRAIRDAPLIGHGSNARGDEYARLVPPVKRVDETGVPTNRIPTHSHLFAAWVDAGILGAVFWLFVLGLVVRALVTTVSAPSGLAPLFLFVDLNLLWDVLFSPFGAERRLNTAFMIVVVLLQLRHAVPARSIAAPPVAALARQPALAT